MSAPPLPPLGGYQPFPPGGVPPTQPWPAGPYPQGSYPPLYQPAYSPPPKRPPRKFWFGIGAALIAIGLVLGLGAGVGGVLRVNGMQPRTETIFTTGGSTTVHLDAGARRVLFVVGSAANGGHPVRCVATGAATSRPSLKRYDGEMGLSRWHAMFTIEATESADYTVSCIGAPSDTFGVGGYAGPESFALSVLSIVAGFAIALVGAVTTIVTAVLRRRRNQVPGL